MNSNYAPTAPAAQGAPRVLQGSTLLQNKPVRAMWCVPQTGPSAITGMASDFLWIFSRSSSRKPKGRGVPQQRLRVP